MHCHELSRITSHCHDEFMNIWCIVYVYDPFTKFDRHQNFQHFKILIPTWHEVTTCLCTFQASLRLACTLARLESCQCEPQNRASVKAALVQISFDKKAPFTVGSVPRFLGYAPSFREGPTILKLHKIFCTNRKNVVRLVGLSYDCIQSNLRDARAPNAQIILF